MMRSHLSGLEMGGWVPGTPDRTLPYLLHGLSLQQPPGDAPHLTTHGATSDGGGRGTAGNKTGSVQFSVVSKWVSRTSTVQSTYCKLTRAANDGWNFKGAPVEKTKVGPSSNGDGTGTWVEGMCEKPSRTMGGASSFIKVQADQSEHCLSRSPQVITTTSTVVVRQPASPTFT
ncbi:unnamed protein product [Fusarium graminearum]|uniref:Uncharacterized protein n=1 Tax=Gibberella zeae (strain ATCC MYA-4620 / CBS 123657 / FGSC 9075 / NRRL 31084 / PH-1) TaxID=229533 RepID=A0A098D2V1_GIBZE|nr:unnamed protein product [Fusarium graminearum]